MAAKLEYIWLDGYAPTQSLRSKTRVEKEFNGTLEDCPVWSFDGSSTEQATGGDSDCLLKPVAIFPDPDRRNDQKFDEETCCRVRHVTSNLPSAVPPRNRNFRNRIDLLLTLSAAMNAGRFLILHWD